MSLLRQFLACLLLLAVAACGGGGATTVGGGTTTGGGSSGGTGGSGSTGTTPALTNFTTVVVDTGPTALTQAQNGYLADNMAFVSVKLCVPGTTTCQTIDHVQVDTGSVGLRILRSALDSAMLSGLPTEADASKNPVGECYTFVDGYAFGSVRQADFTIGGEAVAGMPFQLVGDTGNFSTVPSECSSGGGADLQAVTDFGANGIIGIGTTATDCGSICTTSGGYSAAIYYDCPASGCSTIITRAASTTAPFEQLPNPVAAMATDNNGTILSLPAAAADGSATLTGTLYFGIGTETNNGLASAKILTTTTSSSFDGAGLLTAIYKGRSLRDSFIDSGSNAYYFVDSSIPQCTDSADTGFYCPSAPLALDPTLMGQNGASADAGFTLYNTETLFSSNDAALPGVGADPNALSGLSPYANSFDFGLPFFYGKNLFTAIEGRTAAGTVGPYFAF